MTIYSSCFSPFTGYGRIALAAKQALFACAVNNPIADIAVCNPGDTSPAPVRMTTWESDALPPNYVGWKNARLLIVPCEHNRKLFKRYTKKPVEVLPQFADTIYEHLPPARPFRFVCVARDNGARSRKGIDLLIKWFTDAFPSESDVSLSIKLSPHCVKRWTFDKRINLIYEDWNRDRYIKFLAAHHCGVFLSGGEGWNLPANELLSMGRPSILLNLGGPSDFTNEQTSYYVKHTLIKAPINVYKGAGNFGAPDKRSTVQAMQLAYGDQLLLAEKSVAAAKLGAEFTQERFAAKLRNILSKYGFQTNS